MTARWRTAANRPPPRRQQRRRRQAPAFHLDVLLPVLLGLSEIPGGPLPVSHATETSRHVLRFRPRTQNVTWSSRERTGAGESSPADKKSWRGRSPQPTRSPGQRRELRSQSHSCYLDM